MCYELGRLSQGFRERKDGANTFFFVAHGSIKKILKGQTITYAHIVVNYQEQKLDPYHIRVTAGGSLINFPGKLIMRTADMTTSKMLWNRTVYTPEARYMCAECANF
jgi:hypothetical protein